MQTTVEPPAVSDAAGHLAQSALQLAEHRLQLAWHHAKRAGAERLEPALWTTAAVAAGALGWLLLVAAAVTALRPSLGLAGALAAAGAVHALLAGCAAWRARA